ncbi:hypothetical protein [Sphingobacterium tabacisoli]|uniref:DUF4352 domain-containing protein n=1 Tax=Sphingobacterium tabacisoli TaxID=2044855 RepID=A0ABW5L493_9SPHI|nr:hypothetical protein [Sphingobacterium tabacisoli]
MTKDNFPELSSRHSLGLTHFIKGFGWVFSVFVIVFAVFAGILVFAKSPITIGFKIPLVGLCILLLLFFGRLIISSLQKGNESTIVQITVDKCGVNYFEDGVRIRTLYYEDLKESPESGGYDVFLDDTGEGGPYYLLFYVVDPTSGNLKMRSLDLNSKSVILNGNKLSRHFVMGILLFRPDLKIAPGVLDLYRVEV